MEPYIEGTPLWDLSHASSFSQLADDDFLALLQKQFPTEHATVDGRLVNGVNPQNISRYSLPSITPPSEDSSPSPPNLNNDGGGNDDGGDPVLKRKASDEDFEEGPSQKSQHTGRKSAHSRRKSTGASGPPKDESRLLKRKEQNRAAQRAFRERKEKHVKDLEDKVAALEAKNEQALSENENLRDLLARLQSENLSLKQGSSFTFAVPKTSGSNQDNTQASTSFASQSPEFASTSSSAVSRPLSSAASPRLTNPLEWSSLTTFDPAMLNLLDDSPQQTATDGAMQMDFGFGGNNGMSSSLPFTTIASNPMFMSYASSFDSASPPMNANQDHGNSFSFDMNGLSSWHSPPQQSQEGGASLDDLLAFNNHSDFSFTIPSSTSESPVAHHSNVNHVKNTALASHSPASSSSPSSSISDPLFDTARDSSASDSDVGLEHNDQECPKTKAELVQRIVSAGPSPFAPVNLRKSTDGVSGPMIMCEGTNFPKVQQSDQNIEVLSAWRSITSNPQFKDVDINNLCTEFTNKARCDGTKVVLEPQGVNCIIQSLSKK